MQGRERFLKERTRIVDAKKQIYLVQLCAIRKRSK